MEGRASGLVLGGCDLLSREDSPELAQSVLQFWGRLNCAFGQRRPSSFASRLKLWLRALSLRITDLGATLHPSHHPSGNSAQPRPCATSTSALRRCLGLAR